MTPTLELSADEIAMLEKMRAAKAKKEEEEKRKNMPGFSFRIEMMDGQSVVWSGKAPDADTALVEAIEKANSENASGVLDHCKRLYMPKGRKPLTIADAIVPAPDGDAEEEQAA
jgi:hypothetical protein